LLNLLIGIFKFYFILLLLDKKKTPLVV